jgi:acyl-CoA thioester hydrolase
VSRRSCTLVRVGYVDTDQAGIAHHASYLRWLEQARIEHLREGGLDYGAWERATRLGLPVVDVSVRYLLPCRFDDLVSVETWVGAASRAAIRYDTRLTLQGRPDVVVNESQIRLACVHLEAGPRTMPDEVLLACLGPGFEERLVGTPRTRPGR